MAGLVLLWAVPGAALGEFRVNTTTANGQLFPAVAADGGGKFVVVWQSYGQDGDISGIFGQRYDDAGAPLGVEFQVNTFTTGYQNLPSVAADAAGNFVVAWYSIVSSAEIMARRYDDTGAPIGGEFQVNTYTTGYRSYASVAADGAGNFVVIWVNAPTFSTSEIAGRRYDNTGTPLGDEFQVNSYTTNLQRNPSVAFVAPGGFVVTWASMQDGDGWGIFAQRYDGAGTPLGGEFQVNSYTTGDQFGPTLAALPSGFVIAWAAGAEITAQRYDDTGTPLGGEFQVNSYTTGGVSHAAIAADAAGAFVVTWQGAGDDPFFEGIQLLDTGIFGQRYDATGAPLGGEFLVNTSVAGDQRNPAVAADAVGNFLTVWSGPEGLDYGNVFGQYDKPGRPIRGRRLDVGNPTLSENDRTVLVLGDDDAAAIGHSVDGDPTVHGATLRLIASGTTPSDQTYVLDASGWRGRGSRFRYAGPTGADADSVKSVRLALRKAGAKARLRAVLRGRVGMQSLDVVPPNTGDGGALILQIGGGGGTYCVTLGGAAGGTETDDTAVRWRLVDATANPDCASP
jgi:hypothetical protein